MTQHAFILFPGTETWRIGGAGAPIDVPIPPAATAGAITALVATGLKSAGYRGQGVLLAPASDACLCAAVKTTGLPQKNRRQAIAYRLEEKLPVAVEDVVADFIPNDPGDNETFGVCTQKRPLAEMVDALETAGVAVAAICPAALLALQHILAGGKHHELDAIVWPAGSGSQLELFILRGGRLHGWSIVAGEPKDLLLQLKLELGPQEQPATIAVCNLPPDFRKTLVTEPGLKWAELSIDPVAGATSLAAPILAGKVAPWIDLRRDDLAVRDAFRRVRMPLVSAAIAVSIGLLVLCGAMLWRASRYDAAANQFADRQQAEFRQVFPGVPIPPDVRSRLEAEERNLRGLSGDTAAAPPPQEAGLLTLRELITHLPKDDELRYRVLEVRLDDGNRFTLEGQATAHGDADAIVAALRRGNAFTVEPPRTEQLTAAATGDAAKGVAFTLTGRAGK